MQPDTADLGTGVIIDAPHPDKPQDDLQAISDLISGGPTVPEQQDAAEQQQPDDGQGDLGEETIELEEAEPAQIDYDAVIKVDIDGQSSEELTVEQLKDHYQQHRTLQQERDDWEDTRSQQQGELMATRQQLLELAGMLQDVKPEVVQYLQNMNQATQQREAALLLQVYPEWADADKKQEARDKHLATVKEYGFNELEYGQITDHRVIRVLDELTRLKAREAAGKAKAEQLKAELPKGQKTVPRRQTESQKKRAMVERAKGGTEQDKLSAISTLIGG